MRATLESNTWGVRRAQSLLISVCPPYRWVMSDVAQIPQNARTIFNRTFRLNTIRRPCFSLFRSQLAAKLEFPQTYTVVSRFLGAIIHPCPSFVQARGRTSVLNQCRTQKQCGESTGSQVVWTLLLQSGVWTKPSYWEGERALKTSGRLQVESILAYGPICFHFDTPLNR